jgi:ribosome-binding factor A
MPYKRTDRVSDVIRREVSAILLKEVKDPRLRSVTITQVRMARDLKSAKVYYSLPSGLTDPDAAGGLESASGFIQKKLGDRIRLRYTPRIQFVHDDSIEYGQRMDKLLSSIEKDLEED